MAQKALYDLTLKISANSAELQKGLVAAKNQIGVFGTNAGKSMKAVAGTVDEIGGALGGLVGNISSSIGALGTALGPIGLIVAAIGIIAKVWQTAKENIDLYLNSVDKLGKGSAMYDAEADAAAKNARKTSRGAVRFDQKTMAEAMHQSSIIYNAIQKETDEIKKAELQTTLDQLVAEYNLTKEKIAGDKAVRSENTGLVSRIVLQEKLKKLYEQQDAQKRGDFADEQEWARLETERYNLKAILVSKGENAATGAEKAKAMTEYEALSLKLKDLKLADLTEEYNTQKQILDLQLKSKESEELTGKYLVSKQELELEYSKDKFQELRLESKVTKESEKQVALAEKKKEEEKKALEKLKEKNKDISKLYLPFAKSINIPGLAKMDDNNAYLKAINNPLTTGATLFEDAWTQAAEGVQEALSNTSIESQALFESLKSSIMSALGALSNVLIEGGNNFKEYAKNVKNAIKDVIGGLIAEGVAAMVTNALKSAALTGPGALILAPILASAAGGLAKTLFSSLIPSFAVGTSFAPGGLSLVGERGPELINLPRGSQVYNNKQTSAMMVGQNINITVDGKISGRDLALILRRTGPLN